jgi:hypothetical protein
MLHEGWVFEIAPPHRRVPAPTRPCAECGVDCRGSKYYRQCCRACYMRRYRREIAQQHGRPYARYYRRGEGCAVCGLVPLPKTRGRYGLRRGLCNAHYQSWWRATRPARAA